MAVAGVEIVIEELVLIGFAPRERRRVERAFEQELARRVLAGGVPSALTRGGDLDTVACAPVRVPTNATPEAVAARVAGSVYRGLGR